MMLLLFFKWRYILFTLVVKDVAALRNNHSFFVINFGAIRGHVITCSFFNMQQTLAKQHYFIKSKLNGFVLTAVSQPNGVTVVLNSSKNNPPTSNQQWLFEQQPGGSYYIISRLNGKLLDTSGGGRQLGEEVVLSDRYAGENQRWHRKGVYIVSAKNGNVLDICGASRAPNAQIIAWCKKSVFNSINQQFELEKVGLFHKSRKLDDISGGRGQTKGPFKHMC